MTGEENPYSSPAAVEQAVPSVKNSAGNEIDFRAIVYGWERLRPLYNIIMVVFVLVLSAVFFAEKLTDPLYWMMLMLGGGFANLCYLTAAAVEAYTRFVFGWHRNLTYLLFAAGLLFTIGLAVICLFEF